MKGKHVLITGHTGFKGSWLTAMLHMQGAKVSGIALEPSERGIFELAGLHEFLKHDIRQDIRDGDALEWLIQKTAPDVVIHLAAQPLVLASYSNPTETYETNVLGTLNVLKAVEATPSVQATLVITTDKVYRQDPGVNKAFVETDPLGAADPYSTSKAMADLLTQSWIASRPESKIAIARAGNVIGGGDAGANRLLPDLVRAFESGDQAAIRHPTSVRPWQHVLDCVEGYHLLTRYLISGVAPAGAYNFGPNPGAPLTVREVVETAGSVWGAPSNWQTERMPGPVESDFLTLDSSKSLSVLGWHQKLSSLESVRWAISWEKRRFQGESPRYLMIEHLNSFSVQH